MFLRGRFHIVGPDGCEIFVSSARARGLIIFLCLTPGHKATREKLAEILWTAKEGRCSLANLRQDLSVLHNQFKESAPGVLVIDNDAIALDPTRVVIDLVDEAAAIADRTVRLPDWVLQRVELLAGFKALKSDFDDWLDEQRRMYIGNKLEQLTRRTKRIGAAKWTHADLLAEARALADHYPSEELFCQNLMQLLTISGTTTEVKAALRRCKDAAHADDIELDDETVKICERSIAQIVKRQSGVDDFSLGSQAPASPLRVESVRQPVEATEPVFDPICVGIRPIQNLTGSDRYGLLAAQIYSAVLTDLQMLARPFSIIELPPDGIASSQRESMCRYIATPRLSVSQHRGVPTVNVEMSLIHANLTNPRPSRILHPLNSVLDDRLPLANRVATKLFLDLVIDQNSRLDEASNAPISRAELVVRGLAMLNRRQSAPETLKMALGFFSAAHARYQNDPDALVGIAHVYHRIATQPFAGIDRLTAIRLGEIAANRVLDIDPEHTQSMYVSAMLHSAMGQPDRAANAFDQLLGQTSHIKAMTYRGYNEVFLDRPKRGLQYLEESLDGLQDDPSMMIWHFFVGVAHFHCGDYAEAIAAMRQSLLQDPNYMSARLWLAGIEQVAGCNVEAANHANLFKAACPHYSLVDFNTNWGEARTRNHAYLSRTQVMVDALKALELPQGR